ncbi:MAG: hypothetical protein CMD20_02965 [Flavobacteriales bacterium]|nr:hypothetical protein [Flavobacteriales bacterium]
MSFLFKIASMKIQNVTDSFLALNKIKNWLQAGDFNRDSYTEIESIIDAVEDYMGIPLPAKHFIESKFRNN